MIQTADARLLMLVEADCLQGESGAGVKGGRGGVGGTPGVGGKGGMGGSGGPSTERWNGNQRTFHHTYSGHPGVNGRNGGHGRPGANGKDSKRGRKAQAGGILWVLKSEGRVLKANTRYDAQVLDLKVESILKGGIFETNERITVSAVRVKNTGGMDLPSGAIASMTSTDTVKFEPCSFQIPAIAVGCEYTIPFRFHGRIFDAYPPNKPGRENFKATLSTRIELLGRPFDKSIFRKKIEVRYLVQLGNLRCPQLVDRGEVAQFSIEVSNISNLPYGSCKGSKGRVVLQLHFDSRLIPLGKVAADGDAPYDVTYNHNVRDSTFVELHEIPPKKTITVCISVLAEKSAELFAHCYWQADLRLHDKLIEYNQQSVRVTPKYDTQKPPSEVLLVTSQNMTNMDFVFWSHLFHTAGVLFDVWDTSLYSGFSIDSRTGAKHRDSWYGRYTGKTIIYFHTDPWLFSGSDIARHFHGDNFNQMPLEELNSSLIVFTPQSSNYSELAMLRHLAKVNPKVDIADDTYRGLHLSRPNLKRDPPPYTKWEKKIINKIEKGNLGQLPLLSGRETQLKSLSCFNYSYGSIDVRYLPLLKSSKYLLVDSAGNFDAGSSPFAADIQLSSKYGQAIVATIFGLSIPAKLRLLKKQPGIEDAPNEPMFIPSKGAHLSLQELVMISLACEVADELFSCSGEVHRMQQTHDDVIGNTQAYLESGHTVLRGLKLIEREIRKRRSGGLKHAMVTQACRRISNMIKSMRRALVGAGVKKSKLKNLTSLGKLQTTTVHRCHQEYVKDGKWNLVDI